MAFSAGSRRGGVQERLRLHGQGEAPGDAADFVVQHAHIGVGQLGGGLGALAHDEVDHLVEGSLLDLVGFLGGEHGQRHRDVAVPAGQLEEEVSAQDLRLVRIVREVLQPALVLVVVFVHGQVHGLDRLEELVGGTDTAVHRAPLVVHRVQGAPVTVGEALHAGLRIGVLGIVRTAVAQGAAHVGDVLVRHVSVDVGEHLLDIAVRQVHVLPAVVAGGFVEVQEIASGREDGHTENAENLFHGVSRFRS